MIHAHTTPTPTPATGLQPAPGLPVRLRCDQAEIPAGTVGRVIGFYRRTSAQTLVQFAQGQRVVSDHDLDTLPGR